jgi:RNA polymerase-binding transcription factor DksA
VRLRPRVRARLRPRARARLRPEPERGFGQSASAASAKGERGFAAKSAKRPPPARRPDQLPRPSRLRATAPPTWKTPQPTSVTLREGDLKRLEELLIIERQRLLRELGHLANTVLKRSLRETSGELSGYSFHMADVGTDAMEREKAFHFASSEGRALLDVDDALRRLYGGVFGNCESCGNPIGRERLEVVPHARLCVPCKQKEERSQIGRS